MKLLVISDFTEQFPYRLLKGVLSWSQQENQACEVCKMPPSYKREIGLDGVIDWAKKWKADVVIGLFDPDDDVSLFRKNGIIAIAQDYISRFDSIPNISADDYLIGSMVAARLCGHGFKHLGFFGYHNVCWSEGREKGFTEMLKNEFQIDKVHVFKNHKLSSMWNYNSTELKEWLLKLPKPIGIFACDDNRSEILLEACKVSGINVPLDVAIIGVDNDEVTCTLMNPSLSSVDMNIEKAGYQTAQMAAKMVQDKSYPGEDIIIHPIAVVGRESTGVQATNDMVVAAALRYIYQNRSRKIQVSDVVRQVPVSRRLLEQRFKKVTGASIFTVISSLRIDYFAQQLISSSETVSEIAFRMEETDAKSISRRFLAIKGCTPSEYRKREFRKLGE